MPENDDERKKQSEKEEEDSGLGKSALNTFFQGIGGLIDFVSRVDEEAKEEKSETREFTSPSGRTKGVFGFSVKTGIGGIGERLATEFATNERHTPPKRTVVEKEKQLPIDIFDEQDHILVLVELPGVEEKDIHIEVNGDILTFGPTSKQQNTTKEVILPQGVDENTLTSRYKNGILEIRIDKKQHDRDDNPT